MVLLSTRLSALAQELAAELKVVLLLLQLMRMFNIWVCHFAAKLRRRHFNTRVAMALVWLFSPQYPLAMLPFGVYSIFHVATYTRTNLIPTLQPPQQTAAAGASPGAKPTFAPNATADMIGKFVKEYYDASMGLVAILEILLWGRILLSAIVFQKGSWILIAIYTAFLRARFAQSSFVQGQFGQLEARIDSLVGAQSTPPVARQVWGTIKNASRTFRDATDVGHYVNGAPAQKKAT
jgi:hypothetical protein